MAGSSGKPGNVQTKVGQLHGQARKLMLLPFDELVGEDMDGRRKQLLGRCQEVYELAHGQKRVLKDGTESDSPDYHAMVKVVELSANLLGVIADATRRVNKPEDQEQRAADIEQIAGLLRSVGYDVTKAA